METRIAVKMQSAAMILLMIATTFASTPSNTTLLNAYIRHVVVASQDQFLMTGDRAGTVTEQQVLSDHFIRVGRHTRLLNENMDAIEQAILNNPNNFVYGDWSKQIAAIQDKLNGMGFKGTVPNPDATHRATTLAHIQKYGLKGYIRIIGAAMEQQGANFVSPYSYYMDPMSNAHLLPAMRPVCEDWLNISGDLGAAAGIAILIGQPELGGMFGGAAGFVWFYARYIC